MLFNIPLQRFQCFLLPRKSPSIAHVLWKIMSPLNIIIRCRLSTPYIATARDHSGRILLQLCRGFDLRIVRAPLSREILWAFSLWWCFLVRVPGFSRSRQGSVSYLNFSGNRFLDETTGFTLLPHGICFRAATLWSLRVLKVLCEFRVKQFVDAPPECFAVIHRCRN